jgi:hypothetical protein
VQTNLLGVLYCAHAALPHLLDAAQRGPRQVTDLVNDPTKINQTLTHVDQH